MTDEQPQAQPMPENASPSVLLADAGQEPGQEQTNSRPNLFQPGNKIGKVWQKGQSGNPKGRPKEEMTTAEMVIELRRRGPAALKALDLAMEAPEAAPDDPAMLAIGLKAAAVVAQGGFNLGPKGTEVNVNIHAPQSYEGWSDPHFSVADRLEAHAKTGAKVSSEVELLELLLAEAGGGRTITIEATRDKQD